MKNILCTCPPMIAAISSFTEEFEKYGASVHCPVFQQEMSESELIEIIVRWGIGTDNVDFTAAKKLGFNIKNTPGVFNEEVSDVALGYAIGLVRGLFDINRGVRAGNWPKPAGRSFTALSVGVVGYGNIGKATCRKFSNLGCNVTFSDPYFKGESDDTHVVASWPEMIDSVDILVVTCALTPENRHMLSKVELMRAKDGLIVINVGRGPLLDEAALVEALASGKVSKAALDVFENEPLSMDHPLREFDQVVFGSHNGSNTVDAVSKTSLLAIKLLFEEL